MKHELLHGDCLELMPTIPDGSVDMVLTDIPYGKVNRKANIRNLDKGIADVCEFDISDMALHLCRVCSGSIYVFCGTEQVSDLRGTFVESGLSTRLCVWEKTNPSPMNGQYLWLSSIECCVYARKSGAVFNEFCKSSVWRFPTAKSTFHPTQKPIPLLEYLIRTSTNEGATVLDNCMGSGSTGVACAETNRNFIGIEKDANYFAIAQERVRRAYSTPRQMELL